MSAVTVATLHQIGLTFWNRLYRRDLHVTRSDVNSLIAEYEPPEGFGVDADGASGVGLTIAIWAARWVDGGCRIIDSDASYFDAMSMTDLSSSAGSEIRVPWPAFMVRVPKGCLQGPRGSDIAMILVGEQFDLCGSIMASVFYALSGEDDDGLLVKARMPLADLLFNRRVNRTAIDNFEPRLERALCAIVGLLFTMQHTAHFKDGSRNSGVSRRPLRNEPPPHRSIVIGRPINFRAKPSDSHGATGEGTPPAFQTMVRGHIKRQACGPGSLGRKVVWIEPYWRGPEDAPILARPYLVGSP